MTSGPPEPRPGGCSSPSARLVPRRPRRARCTRARARGGPCRAGVRPHAQNPFSMIVLGIDPGLANAGYGVVARYRSRLVALDGGVIDTPAALSLESRLA